MTVSIFARLFRLILLLLFQALILNHVHVLGYATPLVAVYTIMIFPLNVARWQPILWGFMVGIAQDMVCGTPGLGAASLTLVGFWQPSILRLLANKEFVCNEDFPIPSAQSMKWGAFARYATGFLFLYNAAFYLLEAFNFYNFIDLIINTLGSMLMTLLIILVLEGLHFFPSAPTSRT